MAPAPLILFCLLLVMAAASDLARYRIPNILCAALALAGLVLAFPHDLAEAGSRAGAFALLGGGALGLYLAGLLGGGDAKLLMAIGLWTPLPSLPLFIMALAVAGGAQAAMVLAARAAAGPAPADRAARMPYGVSIAAAGLAWAFAQWSAT